MINPFVSTPPIAELSTVQDTQCPCPDLWSNSSLGESDSAARKCDFKSKHQALNFAVLLYFRCMRYVALQLNSHDSAFWFLGSLGGLKGMPQGIRRSCSGALEKGISAGRSTEQTPAGIEGANLLGAGEVTKMKNCGSWVFFVFRCRLTGVDVCLM